jgi:hypothetical protein
VLTRWNQNRLSSSGAPNGGELLLRDVVDEFVSCVLTTAFSLVSTVAMVGVLVGLWASDYGSSANLIEESNASFPLWTGAT